MYKSSRFLGEGNTRLFGFSSFYIIFFHFDFLFLCFILCVRVYVYVFSEFERKKPKGIIMRTNRNLFDCCMCTKKAKISVKNSDDIIFYMRHSFSAESLKPD